jgi:hypothetical protein
VSTSDTRPPLPAGTEHLYTVPEVAKKLGRSPKWVMLQIKEHGTEHTKVGVSTRFTLRQYEAFRDSYVVVANPRSITTGTSKS